MQTVIGLPLDQAVKLRETYKGPLKSAYARQITLISKDCQAESDQGQQPYNICIGQADVQADRDYAIFYNNLQMLCHDQNQLTTLQAFEATWQVYKDSAMKARMRHGQAVLVHRVSPAKCICRYFAITCVSWMKYTA